MGFQPATRREMACGPSLIVGSGEAVVGASSAATLPVQASPDAAASHPSCDKNARRCMSRACTFDDIRGVSWRIRRFAYSTTGATRVYTAAFLSSRPFTGT